MTHTWTKGRESRDERERDAGHVCMQCMNAQSGSKTHSRHRHSTRSSTCVSAHMSPTVSATRDAERRMGMFEPGDTGGANEYSARGDTSKCALIDEPSTLPDADADADEADDEANEDAAGKRSCATDLEAASLAGDAWRARQRQRLRRARQCGWCANYWSTRRSKCTSPRCWCAPPSVTCLVAAERERE